MRGKAGGTCRPEAPHRMFRWLKDYLFFLARCVALSFQGGPLFYLWMALLTVAAGAGVIAYVGQLEAGLGVTGMNDYVSWGLYIANFTYLVGMAAAAVMLVIPVYVYRNHDLHDVVIFGELFAIAAIVMCLLFVTVDLGRPDRFWHLMPAIGRFNWPISMLSWDVVVLNIYLVLNAHITGYLLYSRYRQRAPSKWLYIPFVFISIVWAVSIHTVTAFLLSGLASRPFWNSAVLGPRFIASAFAAGPAFIVLTLQVIRRVSSYQISDNALWVLRSIIQVSMIVNVFLLVNELFKEFYGATLHSASAHYLFFGLHGHDALVPWIWTALAMNLTALGLLVHPVTKRLPWLNAACALLIVGIWIEKGMGLIVPGFVPSPLGEVVDYAPSIREIVICVGVWAIGLMIYTVLVRVAIPILKGRLVLEPTAAERIAAQQKEARRRATGPRPPWAMREP